jgi:membrane protein required for colicin V production
MRTHVLDILVFGILTAAAVQGWRRGFVLEMLNIVGLLVGVMVGFMLYDLVAAYVAPHVGLPTWMLKSLSFLVTTMVVYSLWNFLSKQTKESFKVAGLGVSDSVLGAVFGLMKASLVCAAVFWIAAVLHVKFAKEKLEDSYIAADVVSIGNSEFSVLSQATPYFIHWYHAAIDHESGTVSGSSSKKQTP